VTRPGRFAAGLVIPGQGPAIPGGVIEVTDGLLTDLFPGPDTTATDLGNIVLLPGLVNAHTHLEFSTITAPLPATRGLAAWIGDVTLARSERSGQLDPVRAGLDELAATGTAAVGEIATSDWPADRLEQDDPACVVFREIIGLAPQRHDQCLETARRFLEEPKSERCLRGLSPHAPYSVHPNLYNDLVQLADSHDAPLATHLAESPDELELLAHGTGPLRQRLEALDAWNESAIPSGSRPMDYLVPLAQLTHPLVIHGNLLDDRELDWLAQHRNISVVYCPRTHAHFGHPPHPFRRLLAQGTPVVLGTDSRASNPDLSIWNELQFLARTAPDTRAEDLLAMATSAAAIALGLEAHFGTLQIGKQASVFGVEPEPGSPLTLESILASGRLAGALRHGRWYPA